MEPSSGTLPEAGRWQVTERPNAWPPIGNRARHFVMQKLSYSVVYVTDDDSVIVVAVAHGSRRPDYCYERLSDL